MVFADEYEYLLHLLSSVLHETEPEELPAGLAFEKVLEYGFCQGVANVAFLAVKKLRTPPEKALYDRWWQEYWKAIIRDIVQKQVKNEVLTALHTHGIYTLEVQGTVVMQYYPESHLRMMSDMDFIIPPEKLGEAESILRELGYRTKLKCMGTELYAEKDLYRIELHSDFFAPDRTVSRVLSDPFSFATLHEDMTATVSDTVFYLFHLLHTIKHTTESRGVSIRRILDLYYLETAMKDKADLAYIDDVLRKHGLYDIKKTLIAVKDHWFCGGAPNKKTKALEAEILISGDGGSDAIFNKNQFKQARAAGKRFVRLRHILRFFFPEKAVIYQNHPFYERHHWPVVLCWICRAFSFFDPRKLKIMWKVFSDMRVKKKK